MTSKYFLKAMELISLNHSTTVIINHVERGGSVGELGNREFTISITKCCASVINNLKDEGYRLSMHNNALNVDYSGTI